MLTGVSCHYCFHKSLSIVRGDDDLNEFRTTTTALKSRRCYGSGAVGYGHIRTATTGDTAAVGSL